MARKLALALAGLSFASISSPSFGLGLGEIQMGSTLNQSFRAEIPLRDLGDLSTEQIVVKLASADDFDRARLERDYFLSEFKFQTQLTGGGRGVIVVTSHNPVTEPIVGFLIDVAWPNGRLQKEFTVLLDPPREAVLQPQTPITSSSVQPAPTSSAPTVAPAVRDEPERQNSSASEVTVPASRVAEGDLGATQRNDTAWSIAERIRPSTDVSIEQAMMALLRANPDAFIDGNVNKLKVGQVLRVPTADEFTALSRGQARAEFAEQTRQWRGVGERRRREEDTEVAQSAPVQGTDPEPVADEPEAEQPELVVTGDASVPSTGAGTAEPEPVVSTASETPSTIDATVQGELDSIRQAQDALQQQLQVANQRITQLDAEKRALETQLEAKDDELAALQSNSSSSTAAAQPVTTAQATSVWQNPVTWGLLALAAVLGAGMAWLATQLRAARQMQPATASVNTRTANPAATNANNQSQRRVSSTVRTAAASTMTGSASASGVGAVAPAVVATAAAGSLSLGQTQRDVAPVNKAEDFASTVILSNAEEIARSATDSAAPTSDLISEADIYIAYGRFPQAVSFLRSALERDPQRNDVRLKLMEVFVETKDAAAFSEEAQDLLARSPTADDLHRARQLQARLPGASIIAPEDSGEQSVDFDKTLIDSSMASDIAAELASERRRAADAQAPIAVDVNFDDPNALIEVEEQAKPLDFDLSFSDETDLAATAKNEIDRSLEKTFDDLTLDDTRSSLGGDLGMAFRDERAPAAPGSDDELGLDLTLDGSEPVQPARRDRPIETVEDDDALSLTLDGLDDAPKPDRRPDLRVVSNSVSSADTVESSTMDDLDFLSDADEAGTKLDLARAYVDMGDEDGARDILNEVLAEGNEAQQREARELLAKLV